MTSAVARRTGRKRLVCKSDQRKFGGADAIIAVLSLPLAVLLTSGPVVATPDGWGTARLLETDDTGGAEYAQVVVDAQGNGLAVWQQYLGGALHILASRYTALSGWGSAQQISAAPTDGFPQIAVDAGGNAIAVWLQGGVVSSSRFTGGSGWGSPQAVGNGSGPGGTEALRIAAEPSGTAFVVWQNWDGAEFDIWANRYSPGVGWGTAERIGFANGSSLFPQVVADSGGNALALWTTKVGENFTSLQGNRYTEGQGWGVAGRIDDNTSAVGSWRFSLSGNSRGNAMVVWTSSDATTGVSVTLWASHYDALAGWGHPELIGGGNPAGLVGLGAVRVGSDGVAVVGWGGYDGQVWGSWVRWYWPGWGWAAQEMVGGIAEVGAGLMGVTWDDHGNAAGVWEVYNSSSNDMILWVERFDVGSASGDFTRITTQHSGYGLNPQIAGDPNGTLLVVWDQHVNTRADVWATQWSAVDLRPPVLTLTVPVEGASSTQGSIWVAGSTEPGASLSVNGLVARVAPAGDFGLLVSLRPGQNAIVVVAVDDSGNAATRTVNVTYDDPLPGLQRQLADALANLSAARSELDAAQASIAALAALGNATQADLDTALQQLDAAQAGLAGARADLTTTQAELTLAQARIGVLSDALNATGAQLGVANTEITSAQANLTAAQAQIAALQATGNATRADLDAASAQLAKARADLTAAEGRLKALEAAANGSDEPHAATSSDLATVQGAAALAMIIGLIGILMGAFGAVMALRGRRTVGGGRGDAASSQRPNGPRDPSRSASDFQKDGREP